MFTEVLSHFSIWIIIQNFMVGSIYTKGKPRPPEYVHFMVPLKCQSQLNSSDLDVTTLMANVTEKIHA